MQNKVLKVIAAILCVDKNQLTPDTSPDNLPEWTSIKHMNLVMALEQEFNIQFTQKDIIEMLNIALILTIIEEKQ